MRPPPPPDMARDALWWAISAALAAVVAGLISHPLA
jgi:hypothetical protein